VDLGISGRKALVCAASKGLGRGCAEALAQAGVDVTILARTSDDIQKAAGEIGARAGRTVAWLACDITTPAGRAQALAACPEPDILVNNAGGPPPGDFRDFDRDAWIRALDANMLTPIELIKATIDGMIARRFGRIVNITSGTVKLPQAGLDLSSAARGGLTIFLAGVARQVAAGNVTINNILPGAYETDRLKTVLGALAKRKGISYEEAKTERIASIPAKRLGDLDGFGAACAFLCSVHAGFITGQNLTIDGGAFPGVF
jgi:3-oxoacyl-[acyl-carrier protein] reductase